MFAFNGKNSVDDAVAVWFCVSLRVKWLGGSNGWVFLCYAMELLSVTICLDLFLPAASATLAAIRLAMKCGCVMRHGVNAC